jgi:D-sedoheptulose 7-phosphate isomerase
VAVNDTTFSERFLAETISLLREMDADQIEAVARGLLMVRDQGGRLFVLGVGSVAGQVSHVVNNFRSICHFEAYSPPENLTEQGQRANDGREDSSLSDWLVGSRLGVRDGILVMSLGGGSLEKGASDSLVRAVELCRNIGASVFGVVGRDGGYTAQAADACVVIPPMFLQRVTSHTEGLCAVVWHLLVNHPALQRGDRRPERPNGRAPEGSALVQGPFILGS